MRGRFHTIEVELGDVLDVLEDPGELTRYPLHLVVGEFQAGEAGDVQNLLAVDHRPDSRWRLPAASPA
jgi:hypothetical protein